MEQRIGNAQTLKDLGKTFHKLNKLAESVVKGNFGGLREHTNFYRIGEICSMLQRSMVRSKTVIIRLLSPKMSIVHPWIVGFDLSMPHKVFDLLNMYKEILGLTRYGIEVEDTPGSVTIALSNLRRLSNLFDQFEDCGGFRKQLGKGKEAEAKLIVNPEKKETVVYNAKEQILRAIFFYGCWNLYGISQG